MTTHQQSPLDRPLLFVIENDDVHILAVERIFRRAGRADQYHVLRAKDAVVHLREHISQSTRACIMLGTSARGMELDVLRQLRASPDLKHLPVIVAVLDEEESNNIERMGLDVGGYIIKPVAKAALERALEGVGMPLLYDAGHAVAPELEHSAA